jgi:flagellar biosynthetic protein FlhB
VALVYNFGVMRAPIVTAKGEDAVAQYIKKLARDNDVPIVEDKPLARSLYWNVGIGDIIPDDYATAVIAIYQQIYVLDRNNRLIKKKAG